MAGSSHVSACRVSSSCGIISAIKILPIAESINEWPQIFLLNFLQNLEKREDLWTE